MVLQKLIVCLKYLLVFLFLLILCSCQPVVRRGDTVKVSYIGRLSDGMVFDQKYDTDPLEFEVGAGRLLKKFEDTVVGMKQGETSEIKIEAEQAYGNRKPELELSYPRDVLTEDFKVQVGDYIPLQDESGRITQGKVLEFNDEIITLDLNHPLAGKDLIFQIKVLEIIKK